jgi:uncharacterized membrane protein YdjX (TVP38/TMEM64 family)
MKYLSKRHIFVGLVFVALILIFKFTPVGDFFSLENLKNNREHLQYFVDHHYIMTALMYIASYVVVVSITLPIALFMTIAGGFLFGIVWGVIFANIGATLGAIISFNIIRHFFGKAMQKKYATRLVGFNRNFKQHGPFYLLGLHFVAVVPFFLINVLASLTNISLLTFIWTTSLGLIPASTLFAYMGQKLGTINSVDDILTPQVLMAFMALALLAITPILVSKFRLKMHK